MITREADYAIRLVQYLADHFDTPGLNPVAEISQKMDIPYHHLRLVGTKLAAAGIITSRRGHSGGYRLNRHPSRVSLLEVIDLIDPKCLLINRCLHRDASCRREGVCKAHTCLEGLQNTLNKSLSTITFEQLKQS
jgi:Rrf2 family transcriptional regulator, iron-sulfur cluster assembly transcription factor